MPFAELKNLKAQPRLVLIGNFGAGNAGDELILAGFLKKIKNQLPQAKITVLGHDPQIVQKWHSTKSAKLLPFGLRSLFFGRFFQTLKILKAADAVVFPGGGLFTDTESMRAVILWGLHILAARYFYRPVYLLGQSVGPFQTELGRWFARFCLTKAELIGVRDVASAAELVQLGILKKLIQSGQDSALWLKKSPQPAYPAGMPPFGKGGWRGRRRRTSGGILKILISVRDFPHLPPRFFLELAAALDELVAKKQARIVFAEFGPGDLRTFARLCLHAQNDQNWKIRPLPENPEQLIQFIGEHDLVIGMRLHSIIAAHLAGVPSVALSYSRKVAEFQNQVGRGQFVLPVAEFTAGKLLKLMP